MQLANDFAVSDLNTAETYEKFCVAIGELASELTMTPNDLERLLMSSGGHRKAEWRSHVIAHRQLPGRLGD